MKEQYIEEIQALLEPLLEGSDMFVVQIRIKPTNNVTVYLDADSGISIGRCAEINRKLYPLIEAQGWFPDGDFSLEVSSPGVDEPLTQKRQYIKNIGRKITVTDNEDVERTGLLKEVSENHIIMEIKGKKSKDPVIICEVPFSNIKKTIVQIIFN